MNDSFDDRFLILLDFAFISITRNHSAESINESLMISAVDFIADSRFQNRFKFEGDDFDSVQSLINYHHLNRIPIKSTGHILIVNPVRPAFISGDKFSHLSLDVQLAERLGNGHFGEVFRGVLTKTNQAVAIKTCRAGVDDFMKRKFLEEAEIMKPYDHPNVVRLIGICRDQEPYMIRK